MAKIFEVVTAFWCGMHKYHAFLMLSDAPLQQSHKETLKAEYICNTNLQLLAAFSQGNYSIISNLGALLSSQALQLWAGGSKAPQALIPYLSTAPHRQVLQGNAQSKFSQQGIADFWNSGQTYSLQCWQGSCECSLKGSKAHASALCQVNLPATTMTTSCTFQA